MISGKILGKKYVVNGISTEVSGFVPDMDAHIYYEVIRLIDGKLLFLPDHLDRLQHSISGSDINFPGKEEITENLGLLVHDNTFREGNIRICLQNSPGNETLLQCYFIPYFYPDPGMYTEGVKLAVYPHVRPNPGIKKWDDLFRTAVAKHIRELGVYELVLKNQQNLLTEGSRSNIFYIDYQDQVITTPEKDILPGITRKYVLEIAANKGIPIIERRLSENALKDIAAVFISGTSPKVLPVKQIDDFCFDVSHPLLRLLMDQFERKVQYNLQSI